MTNINFNFIMVNSKTYYELLSSDEFMTRCINECLDKMYQLSEPSITLDELKKQGEKQTSEERKREPMFEQHYLPQEVCAEIVRLYANIFGFNMEWKENIEFLCGNLFNGGRKEVYKEDANGKFRKTYEDTPKLADAIGEENAEKVKTIIEDIKNFYNFNHSYQTFSFNVMNFSPTSNKETVEKYWREHGSPDFTIDEDKWFKEDDVEDDYGDED